MTNKNTNLSPNSKRFQPNVAKSSQILPLVDSKVLLYFEGMKSKAALRGSKSSYQTSSDLHRFFLEQIASDCSASLIILDKLWSNIMGDGLQNLKKEVAIL